MKQQSIESKLKRGGLWGFAGKVALAFSWLVLSMLVTRMLPPTEVGELFLILSVVVFISAVTQLGLGQTATKLIASSMALGDRAIARTTIIRSLTITFFAAVVCSLVTIVIGKKLFVTFFGVHLSTLGTIFVGLWIIGQTVQGMLGEIFRGFHDIRFAVLFSNLLPFSLAGVVLCLLYAFHTTIDLESVLGVFVGSSIFAVTLGTVILSLFLKELPSGGTIALRTLFQTAWPILVTNVVYVLIVQVDLWIVGAYCAKEDAALYAAAIRMVAILSMPLGIAKAFIPPIVAELHSKDDLPLMQTILRGTATVIAVPAVGVGLTFFLFGGNILSILYGEFYQSGHIILAVLTVSEVIYASTGCCDATLVMTKHHRILMGIMLFSLCLTAGLGLVTVQYYGVVGVAISAAFSFGTQNLLMVICTRYYLKVWTHFCTSASELLAYLQLILGQERVQRLILLFGRKRAI